MKIQPIKTLPKPQKMKSPLKWIATAGAIGAMGLSIAMDDKSLKLESGRK